MKVTEHSVTPDGGAIRIYPIGDMHMTLRTFQEQSFRKYIRHIADDPAGVAILMGDVSDARSKEHRFFSGTMVNPRYQIEDIDILEDKAAEESADLLAPIASKLAGILRGNHHQAGFTHTLRRELRHGTGVNIPDLGNRAMLRIVADAGRGSSEFAVKVFATHRDSGGNMPGSQLNNQVKNIISWEADLYLFAHSHRSSFYRQPRMTLKGRGDLALQRCDAMMMNAGSWLEAVAEGVDAYPDEFNLPLQNDDKYYCEAKRLQRNRVKHTKLEHKLWTP